MNPRLLIEIYSFLDTQNALNDTKRKRSKS